jgi:DNA-directed RNA polymerase subunit M/transcription elongation factor TFIIS
MLTKAVELLEDGEWHDLEFVLRELGKLVPPGRAMRRNENDRRLSSGTDARKKDLSETRLIASGKRAIAKDLLNKSYFEIYPLGRVQNKRVRMTELPPRAVWERKRVEDRMDLKCPECGNAEGRSIVGHEVRGVYEGVLFWGCMECGTTWNRWPEGHALHVKAEFWRAKRTSA